MPAFFARDAITPVSVSVSDAENDILRDGHPDGIRDSMGRAIRDISLILFHNIRQRRPAAPARVSCLNDKGSGLRREGRESAGDAAVHGYYGDTLLFTPFSSRLMLGACLGSHESSYPASPTM